MSQLLHFPFKILISRLVSFRPYFYYHKQTLHICSLIHSTKAAIAPSTKGTPVTAAKAAPPPLKILVDDVTGATGVDGEVTACVVGEVGGLVGGTVGGTVDATVGATGSVTDVAMTEDRT